MKFGLLPGLLKSLTYCCLQKPNSKPRTNYYDFN